MTENDITNRIVEAVRHCKLGVAFKHADRFTVGMPDISITHAKGVLWLEIKLITATKQNVIRFDKKSFKLQQLATAIQLERASNHCRYLVFVKIPRRRDLGFFWIYPTDLLELVRENYSVKVEDESEACLSFKTDGDKNFIVFDKKGASVIDHVISLIKEQIA